MRFISEVREVEEAGGGAGVGGMVELMVEVGVTVHEEAVEEHEGLEGDNPVPGLGEAAGNGGDAGGDVGAGGGGEEEYLADVLVLGGVIVVAGGSDDGHLHLRDHAAAHLCQPNAGLVLHGAYGPSDSARCHLL